MQDLRPLQVEAFKKNLLYHDTICMLPTGYGKNLLYELFPIVSEEILGQSCCVFVFEPLNVIIQQQVRKLGSFATCLKEKNDASVLQKLRTKNRRVL